MRETILTMQVDVTSIDQIIELIGNKVNKAISGYICVSNVHMCMEVFDDFEFRKVVNNADWVIPDGKPLTFSLQLLGQNKAQQVRGTDITLALCQQAQNNNWVIGLYGGSEKSLEGLVQFLSNTFPKLEIGCAISPPFCILSEQEKQHHVQKINDAGVQILFVGLGCPKQEKWMAEHKGRVNSVMLGVGAAFDFLSGNKKEAPKWIQDIYLEWLFRLASDPHRLWQRYFMNNPRFIWHFIRQWLFAKKFY